MTDIEIDECTDGYYIPKNITDTFRNDFIVRADKKIIIDQVKEKTIKKDQIRNENCGRIDI